MAKGNFLLHGSRGKVGVIVAQRGTGGTIIREKVQPKTSKSAASVLAKARICGLGIFYKLAKANFHKFAFENKKAGESDFNTFVRINKDNGILLTPSLCSELATPPIGNFITSVGSLDTEIGFMAHCADTDGCGFIPINAPAENMTTVAQLSAKLIANYDLNNGDVVNLVQIQTFAGAETDYVDPLPKFNYADVLNTNVRWNSVKFTVNDSSSDTLVSIGINVIANGQNCRVSWGRGYDEDAQNCASAAFIVVTRKSGSSTIVCNSMLSGNDAWSELYASCQSDTHFSASMDWFKKIKNWWGCEDEGLV